MLARLLALGCLSLMALIGLKLVGGSSGWWPALPADLSSAVLIAAWLSGAWIVLGRLQGRDAMPAEAAIAVAQPAGPSIARRPRAAPADGGLRKLERRAHPRFAVDWPVRATWRDGSATAGVLRDISRGGACLVGTGAVAAEVEGMLFVEGIAVPVPARVVRWSESTGLHVAFQLEGLGLDAFIVQLERQLKAVAAGPSPPR